MAGASCACRAGGWRRGGPAELPLVVADLCHAHLPPGCSCSSTTRRGPTRQRRGPRAPGRGAGSGSCSRAAGRAADRGPLGCRSGPMSSTSAAHPRPGAPARCPRAARGRRTRGPVGATGGVPLLVEYAARPEAGAAASSSGCAAGARRRASLARQLAVLGPPVPAERPRAWPAPRHWPSCWCDGRCRPGRPGRDHPSGGARGHRRALDRARARCRLIADLVRRRCRHSCWPLPWRTLQADRDDAVRSWAVAAGREALGAGGVDRASDLFRLAVVDDERPRGRRARRGLASTWRRPHRRGRNELVEVMGRLRGRGATATSLMP